MAAKEDHRAAAGDGGAPGADTGPEADPSPIPADGDPKPLASSIAVERTFRVDGKKVVVQAVLPATLAKEIGMEAMLACAQRLLVSVESKQAKVVSLKLGEN